MPKAACNMHFVIDNCLTMLQNQLKNKVEIKKNYTEIPFKVLGNEGKLHQAILNIISNAEQSIENNGTIEIHTEVKNNYVLINITDSGTGISPENLPKIFDPFFTTKNPGKGTGLGLSITYKIVEEHEGTLTYESQLGKGTKAIIKLPVIKLNEQ
jgi:signal transduction histidine kinase